MKQGLVMLNMKILCVIFVFFSYIVAVTPNAILTLMSFSWGTVASYFLAPFLYGLYWKGTTRAGALISFVIAKLPEPHLEKVFSSSKELWRSSSEIEAE